MPGRPKHPANQIKEILDKMIKEGRVTIKESNDIQSIAGAWAQDEWSKGAREGFYR